MADTNPIAPEPGRFSIRVPRPLWIGLAAVVVIVAAVALAAGWGSRILTWLVLLLFLDLVSGGLFFTALLFGRILLPLTITVVLMPYCLIWPAGGGADAPHWATVRGRLQSIARMWRGYWGCDGE